MLGTRAKTKGGMRDRPGFRVCTAPLEGMRREIITVQCESASPGREGQRVGFQSRKGITYLCQWYQERLMQRLTLESE